MEGQDMTDYSELIKKLRDLHRDPRPASAEWLFENQVALYDAATAIEALQAQLPKRGKWVGVSPTVDTVQCSVCGGQLFSAELETLYCPYCGAKMEVQDG